MRRPVSQRALVVVVAGALFASACGGSEEPETLTDATSTSQSTVLPNNNQSDNPPNADRFNQGAGLDDEPDVAIVDSTATQSPASPADVITNGPAIVGAVPDEGSDPDTKVDPDQKTEPDKGSDPNNSTDPDESSDPGTEADAGDSSDSDEGSDPRDSSDSDEGVDSASSSSTGKASPIPSSTTVLAKKATTSPKPSTTVRPTTTKPTSTPSTAGAFFSVNFQQTPLGTYTDARIRADWDNIRYTKAYDRAVITEEAGNRFVRVKYPKDVVGNANGGALWEIRLGSNSSEELYASYRIRFVGNFDPVKGGKLPGLAGGTRNTGGDKPNGRDGWSARIMWRPNNAAVQYLYHPDQPSQWGENLEWGRNFPKSEWITVETRIKMNTPGQKNGVVQSWMNGQLVLTRSDIRFRDVDSFNIESFMFSTFFGGSGSDWAATKDEYIDFDEFVISKSPITH